MNVLAAVSQASNAFRAKISYDGGVNFSNLGYYSIGEEPEGFFVSEDQQTVVVGTFQNGHICKSIDGGASFVLVYIGSSSYGIHKICSSPADEDKLWACCELGRILYSSDMGSNWSVLSTVPGSAECRGISMASDTVGFVASGTKVFKTVDGGNNWSEVNDGGYTLADVVAVNTSVVWALEEQLAGSIWKTENGGTDWTEYTSTGRQYYGGRIATYGTSNVWFTGRSSTTIEVIYSSNGGTDWYRTTMSDTYAGLSSRYRVPIIMVTASIGFLAWYSCFYTSDGGQTWSRGGVVGDTTTRSAHGIFAGATVLTEFRSFDIAGSEPADRTSEGSKITSTNRLNFGEMARGNDSNVKVTIFRITNLGAYSTISGLIFWLYDKTGFVGTNTYHADITDTWTQDKTPAQVKAGTPGTCPTTKPSANLTKIGGGNITGVAHADTSQYVYLVDNIGLDENDGTVNFSYRVEFDYA